MAANEVSEVRLDKYLSKSYKVSALAELPWPSRMNSAGIRRCKKWPDTLVQNVYRTTGNKRRS